MTTVTPRPDYQQRVITEWEELLAKLSALKVFLAAPAYMQLAVSQRELLYQQSRVMEEYASILKQRIDLFTEGVW